MNSSSRLVPVILWLSSALSLAAAPVAVDPSLPAYHQAGTVKGEASALVTPQLQPLMSAWIAAFQVFHPNAKINIVTRKADIRVYVIGLGPNTDEVYSSTIAPYLEKYGYDPFHVIVSMGGLRVTVRPQALAIFVHPDNPVRHVTMTQLDAMFSSTRRRGADAPIATWGDLGATGEWAAKPVHLYLRPANNVATWHFREAVLQGGLFKASGVVPGKGTTDEVIAAVEQDPDGVTYGAYGYKTDKVKANVLSVGDASGHFGDPDEVDISAGRYPLSRPLELYVNRPPGQPVDPMIKEFLRFVLSHDGQEIVTRDTADGFLPMPESIALPNRQSLE